MENVATSTTVHLVFTIHEDRLEGFCPRVPVHKGIVIVFSLFRIPWLCMAYCLVFCIGSCVPVHENRTDWRTVKISSLTFTAASKHNVLKFAENSEQLVLC